MLCLEELVGMLRERLNDHNENRVEVQNKLDEMCTKILGDADLLEDKIGHEIATRHKDYEEQIFGLIEKLNKGGGKMNELITS